MTGRNSKQTAQALVAKNARAKRNKQQARSRSNGNGMQVSRQALPILNSNSNHRPMDNKVRHEMGSDFLGTVSALGSFTTTKDRIRKVIQLSPSAFTGARIAQIAALWERYRFTKFSLRYVPSVPDTLAAQFICYLDTDPNDDPSVITGADALMRQATAQAGSQQWNFNTAKRTDLATRADRELYYTGAVGATPRLSLQGVAYIIQATAAINFNGENLPKEIEAGSLYVDWECEFQTPQINPNAVVEPTLEYTQGQSVPAGRYFATLKSATLTDGATSATVSIGSLEIFSLTVGTSPALTVLTAAGVCEVAAGEATAQHLKPGWIVQLTRQG